MESLAYKWRSAARVVIFQARKKTAVFRLKTAAFYLKLESGD